jgi:hypothetical protein
VKIRYFEGVPKQALLSDDYFSQIENDLNECFVLALGISTPNMPANFGTENLA